MKFSNNGFTPAHFDYLVDHILQVPTIQTVFFDWNPIYKEDFRSLPKGEDVIYHREENEPSRFAKFTAPESKVSYIQNLNKLLSIAQNIVFERQ